MTIHFAPELVAPLRATACGLYNDRERREPLHMTVAGHDVSCGRCRQTRIFRSLGRLSDTVRRDVIAMADRLAATWAEHSKMKPDQ